MDLMEKSIWVELVHILDTALDLLLWLILNMFPKWCLRLPVKFIQLQMKLTAQKILRIIFNLYVNVSLLPDKSHNPVENTCLQQFKIKS